MFAQVCRAVQHAHQKGIVHRDLKPSNILVAEQEGEAVPKVIDFGVAKAIRPLRGRLADQSPFTNFQAWLGTPAYMSPEQAGLGNRDIDARSDIYSLGVLLYELLTGSTPFDPDETMKEGYDAVLRTIREVAPPTPSARLRGLATADRRKLEAADSGESLCRPDLRVPSRRRLENPELIRLLQGDLEWIVMKALEKDRTRRYQTAHALAMTLERYRREEPVLARPASAVCRWRDDCPAP